MNFIEIKSTQNDLVKYAVKLQNPKFRKNEKMILLDGIKTLEGIIESGFEFEYLFLKKDNELYKSTTVKNVVFVSDEILKKISTTKTYCDVVGIIKEKEINEEIFYNLNKIALIDSIKDAGNLGTIIRSAVALGMEGIILFGDCVDLYNSKVVRSSAQNMFKIPVITTKNTAFIVKLKKTHKLISTVVDSKRDFFEYEFDERSIIAFGSEADGMSSEILNLSDEKLTLFMDNSVESLNLAICASIAFAFIKLNKRFIPRIT